MPKTSSLHQCTLQLVIVAKLVIFLILRCQYSSYNRQCVSICSKVGCRKSLPCTDSKAVFFSRYGYSKTNNTYIDNIQLSFTNPVAQVKVGSIIGLGVPVEYINVSNSEFIFLKVCKESNFQKTVEPQIYSQTCNKANKTENCSCIHVTKNSIHELPINQNHHPDASLNHVPKIRNEMSVYDSPEPTKKFLQGGSFQTDGYDQPSTSKQRTPLNSKKRKHNFGARETHDVVIIDDDDFIINSPITKNNLCLRKLENNFIKKEVHEFHETKCNTKVISDSEHLITHEIWETNIKNDHKPLVTEKRRVSLISGKEIDPNSIICSQNVEILSHTPQNLSSNNISGTANADANKNNNIQHLPCDNKEITNVGSGVKIAISSKETFEHVPNKRLCSDNNIRSKQDEKVTKTAVQDSVDAQSPPLNVEYEYDYLDGEDDSLLRQLIVDETISKDKFSNIVEDVKPNVDILQANLKNYSASTSTNHTKENKSNKFICDLMSESVPSNSLKSLSHNSLIAKNSYDLVPSASNSLDVKLKSNKPFEPMVYLPTINLTNENTFPDQSFHSSKLLISNSNKYSSSSYKEYTNNSPKQLEDVSLKRARKENDDFSRNIIGNQHKKMCAELEFESTNLKTTKDCLQHIYGLKDCSVVISPLKKKKSLNLPHEPGQLSILNNNTMATSAVGNSSMYSDPTKFYKFIQPHNENQNVDEAELHIECSPLKPVQINSTVRKQSVIYSSDSDSSDSEVEKKPTCSKEELDRLNSKVDLCTNANKNNQTYDNPNYFIHKLTIDSGVNEKENVFHIRSPRETNSDVLFEKSKPLMSVDSATIKNELKEIVTNRVSSSEDKQFTIKENNLVLKHSSSNISYKQKVMLNDFKGITPNISELKPLRLQKLKNDVAESPNEIQDDIKCKKLDMNVLNGNKELDIFGKGIFSDVEIKEEPPTRNELSMSLEESSDEEDNDIDRINYSQMDDIIYISSDDEIDSSQDRIPESSKDVSFGPLPPSPERELCLEEIEQESNTAETDTCMYQKESLLSNFPSDKPCVVDANSKSNEFENNINSSNSKEQSHSIQLESNNEDWWPCLSQGFDSEDNSDTDVHPNTSYNSNGADTDVNHNINENKNELDYVIEKIKKKKVGTSLLTDPKIPPAIKKKGMVIVGKHKNFIAEPEIPNSSYTNIKCMEVRPSRANCIDNANTICSKLDDSGNAENTDCLTLSKKKLKPSWKIKRKNKSNDTGSLRIKIMKTHNLDPYKKIANSISKERHHLVSSSKVSDGKLNHSSSIIITEKDQLSSKEHIKRPNSFISNSKGSENISVKPRSSENKGIAKSSTKSRSQKLTEVNLFKSPTKSSKTKPKPKFKIPKKSTKPLDTSICNKENSASLPIQPIPMSSVMEKRVPTPVECFIPSNTNLGKLLNVDTSVPKGILKSPSKNQLRGPRNRVTFPRYDEDLCKVTIISPRKKNTKNNFTGPDNVKLKEIFIKENMKPVANVSTRVENPQLFIYNICNWNYDWLSTYQKAKNNPSRTKMPNPPKVCESTMLPTLTVYNSYDEYKEVFSNLMYYETWENVFKDWEQHLYNNTWFQSLVDSIQPGYIKTNRAPLKYCTVKVVIPISRDLSLHGKHPNQGSLIAMKHKHNNKTISAFGYVQNIVKKPNLRYMPQELKAICKNNEDIVMQLTITFSKLYLENSMKPGMLISLSNVSYVRPSLRAYEALCQLRNSPLCPALLNPGIICSMKNNEDCKTAYIIPEITLNKVQKNAIMKVSDECTENINQPKISLVHGPPGTGKTRTITALIAQINLLYKEKKLRSRRILLCAPSNAAVDELTYKLMKLREVNLNLNIVRFGVEQSFSQLVNECSFETKVRKEFEKRITQSQNKSVQQELQQKKQYALSATEDYEKALKDKKSKSEIKQLEIRMIELLRSEKDLQERSKNYLSSDEKLKLNNDCKKMILMQAEVIACTLNSCLSGAVYEIFSSQPSSFACCIVDEAGQCKETETWMPLQLGISRLILVGDHLQLPATVLSNVAQGKKLHQSLFERIFHHVGIELQNKTVIHSLTLQYRMHEDICAWPSSHFYYSMLHTAPGVSQERKCFLKPIILFDLEDSIEVNEYVGEICNKIEVQAVISILDCIASQIAHFSVGILTPYQKQRILLSEKVKPYNKDIKIKVSTIDNFQGQERDLIICSFVRANVDSRLGFVSDRQRLNVALTRARRALIVIGHMQSLKSNEDWKSLIEDCQHRNLLYRVNLKLLSQKKELYKLLEVKA